MLLVWLVLVMSFCRLINVHWMYSGISRPKENNSFQILREFHVIAKVDVSLRDSGQCIPLLISHIDPIIF